MLVLFSRFVFASSDLNRLEAIHVETASDASMASMASIACHVQRAKVNCSRCDKQGSWMFLATNRSSVAPAAIVQLLSHRMGEGDFSGLSCMLLQRGKDVLPILKKWMLCLLGQVVIHNGCGA